MKRVENGKQKEKQGKYILDETDIEEFQVLVDCLASLYGAKDPRLAGAVRSECNLYLKKKIEELEARLADTSNIRAIQEANLKTKYSIYHFSLFKSIGFIEKYVAVELAMILRLIYNSLSSTFEGMKDLLGDALKTGSPRSPRSHPQGHSLQAEDRARRPEPVRSPGRPAEQVPDRQARAQPLQRNHGGPGKVPLQQRAVPPQ